MGGLPISRVTPLDQLLPLSLGSSGRFSQYMSYEDSKDFLSNNCLIRTQYLHFNTRCREFFMNYRLQWHNTFWNEILLSELMLIKNESSDIAIYKGLSNDHIVYLNLFDDLLFCEKIWGFLLTKNRKIRLCLSCINIEYT